MTSHPQASPTALQSGTFVPGTIHIPVEPMLRIQGYRDMDRVRPVIRDTAAAVAARAEELLAPEARYRLVGVEAATNGILALETGTRFRCKEFRKVLAHCRQVIVVVVTVGAGLDDEAEALTRDGRILDALFLETAGWIGIERATRALRQHLSAGARADGARLSRRLGPGYGDWGLDEQHQLFTLFEGAPMPVRLLESCAMVPKMSRSGLYGIIPGAAAVTRKTGP